MGVEGPKGLGPDVGIAPMSEPSPLALLLGLEAAARDAETTVELAHLIATDWRKLVRAMQIFVFVRGGGDFQAIAASSQSSVDRTSPLIADLETGLARRPVGAGAALFLRASEFGAPADSALASYPFQEICLAPLKMRDGHVFALALLARETPWTPAEQPTIERLAGAFAHAWQALAGQGALRRAGWRRYVTPAALALLVAAAVVPVPLTALAPVEVAGRDPAVVSAPLDGVIRRVEIDPNTGVKEGDVLVAFVDTSLRGRAEVAEQNVLVAQARERRMTQAAFTDRNARRELAVAQAELGLALAERDAAREALDRSILRAERSGVAVYQNRADLEGKPVSVGERLLVIADPQAVEYRIELPVKDAIVAREGARVRVYLDADPLAPLEAKLTAVSFHASPTPGNVLAFILRAEPQADAPPPRIGFRGTAQIYGEKVSLGYYLLRRPITALRQNLGI